MYATNTLRFLTLYECLLDRATAGGKMGGKMGGSLPTEIGNLAALLKLDLSE
jgi:hypothetical protein